MMEHAGTWTIAHPAGHPLARRQLRPSTGAHLLSSAFISGWLASCLQSHRVTPPSHSTTLTPSHALPQTCVLMPLLSVWNTATRQPRANETV